MERYFPSVCGTTGLAVIMRSPASSPSHFLNSHSLVPFQHQSVGILSSPYVISLALNLWPWSKLNKYSLICFLIFKHSGMSFYALHYILFHFSALTDGTYVLFLPLGPYELTSSTILSTQDPFIWKQSQHCPQRWRFNCRCDATSSENSAC